MEYEFDLVCDIDWAHIMSVSKSRCSAVADMKIEKPGPSFMAPVMEWLQSGTQVQAITPEPVPAFTPAQSSAISLDDLTAQYGIDKILETNGGMIPSTQEELDLIAGLLAVPA
jgi:hypothetical protein